MNHQLPPLPEPFMDLSRTLTNVVYDGWADQMTAYGLQCAEAALQGVKVRIPTETMEQTFQAYHQRGYKAGAEAERARCMEVAAKQMMLAADSAARAAVDAEQQIFAEMLAILESDETSAETTAMAKRHHDLVQRLRGRVANEPAKDTP